MGNQRTEGNAFDKHIVSIGLNSGKQYSAVRNRTMSFYTNAVPTGLKSLYSHHILETPRKAIPPENRLLTAINTHTYSKIDTYGAVRKPHHRCQFSDFSQHFEEVTL